MIIDNKDREILRKLAFEQAEIANSPEMKEIEKLWYLHNDVKGCRPMITAELAGLTELTDPLMQCTGEDARALELRLLRNILNAKYFKDDSYVAPFFAVTANHKFTPFGLPLKVEHSAGLGHHFVSQIEDLEDDFDKLKKSTYSFESEEDTKKRMDELDEIFGDILPTNLVGRCMYSVPAQDIVHIMSMEDMFVSIMDYPELFHQMMDRLTDDYLEYYDEMRKQGFLLPTNHAEHLGQGTYCFTNELSNNPKSNADQWLFMDAQETSSVSPSMYAEFFYPYYKKLIDQFGLFSYGCCEPVHPVWENCLSNAKNLRKISISPWCDEDMMGEMLKGTKTIYHRKPSPNFLGIHKTLDEDAFRAHIAKTLQAAKGCAIEFTQRDVYTIHNDFNKAKRWVEIIREECAK